MSMFEQTSCEVVLLLHISNLKNEVNLDYNSRLEKNHINLKNPCQNLTNEELEMDFIFEDSNCPVGLSNGRSMNEEDDFDGVEEPKDLSMKNENNHFLEDFGNQSMQRYQ